MKLDFYIFREWLKVFLLTFGMLLGLLILSNVQDELQDLIGQGASFEDVVFYYFLLTPSYLPDILPFSLLISVLFVLGQLHRNHEITAMKVAGLGLFRMFRVLWLLAFLLTGLVFYLNAHWVPWSVVEAREVRQNFQFSQELAEKESLEEVGTIYNLTFFNHRENRMWFINRFNEYDYFARGITVSILDEKGQEKTRIVANRGYFDDVTERWHFQEGREITFDPESGDPIRSLPFETQTRNGFEESPEIMKFLEMRPEDLALVELDTLLRQLETSEDSRIHSYKVEYYHILFQPLSCLVMVGLAVPFSIVGVRSNPVVGLSKALGWFVLYYLALQIGEILGRGGFNPVISAGLPSLTALAIASFFTIRATRPE